MKAKVFIASSVEGLEIAKAIQSNLDYDFETTVWSQDIFKLSSYTLESLFGALDKNDFGIFVFSPDDEIQIRDEVKTSVRDNVIFELGLFVGRFGKNSNFIVKPRNLDIHIPSDLFGLTMADYEPNRSDGNLKAALGPACTQMSSQINDLFVIDYPKSGHHGINILNKSLEKLTLEQPYSLRAKLKQGQNLKIHIKGNSDQDIWHMSTRNTGAWIVDRFNSETREQLFHLKGPVDGDMHIEFKEGENITITYYENSLTQTYQKTLSAV